MTKGSVVGAGDNGETVESSILRTLTSRNPARPQAPVRSDLFVSIIANLPIGMSAATPNRPTERMKIEINTSIKLMPRRVLGMGDLGLVKKSTGGGLAGGFPRRAAGVAFRVQRGGRA